MLRSSFFQTKQKATPALIAVLFLFVAVGMGSYWRARGDDLASSYVGSRVLAAGQTGVLYTHDPDEFSDLGAGRSVWLRLSRSGSYRSFLHPYVQTPLWAWALEPLSTNLQFPAFKRLFLALALLAIAGSVTLVALRWTPALSSPALVAFVLAALFLSQPFGYAMELVQTHALFLFCAIYGLVLAEDDKPFAAGFLVALAAAVKLTPAVLVLYWVVQRRWRAVFSCMAFFVLLLVFTRVVLGQSLLDEYFAQIHRASQTLLVAENNQSFAAWFMGRQHPRDDIYDIAVFPLPAAVRWVSTLLLGASAALGGWLDRKRVKTPRALRPAPLGVGIALVGMTLFAPIAWTHYFILLVIPVMLLVQESHVLEPRRIFWIPLWFAFVICIFNYPPLAADVLNMDVTGIALVRGQFYAGALSVAALLVAAALRRRTDKKHTHSAELLVGNEKAA